MGNIYQYNTVSSIAGVISALSSFATTQGWTVNTTTPTEPIFTLPTTATLINWKVAPHSYSGDHLYGLEISASGSAIPTSTCQVYNPRVASGTSTPTVLDPTGVHLFITEADVGVYETPSMAVVIEYPDATYRHFYIGRLVTVDSGVSGEVVSGIRIQRKYYTDNRTFDIFSRGYDSNYLFSANHGNAKGLVYGGVHYDHASNLTPWRSFSSEWGGNPNPLEIFETDDTTVFGGLSDGINDYLLVHSSAPYAGLVPLITMNLFAPEHSTGEIYYRPLGYPPNVFGISVKNYNSGDEVTLAGITYKIFPAMRKGDDWYLYSGNGDYVTQENSYTLGYAYPKNL